MSSRTNRDQIIITIACFFVTILIGYSIYVACAATPIIRDIYLTAFSDNYADDCDDNAIITRLVRSSPDDVFLGVYPFFAYRIGNQGVVKFFIFREYLEPGGARTIQLECWACIEKQDDKWSVVDILYYG